ncbi:trypsin-like peptidase domain-containing protein [Micromonospora sp. NPDC000668]|uniref:VMAP-C domain-containing protein n=1 Tax=Micromonospora sp. NPDC000668 TaxID=3364219 RepID=UPI0036B73C14
MSGEHWPARVFDAGRPRGGGSGFVITPEHVMTAAHVVYGMTEPTVELPARPDLGKLSATVEFVGTWQPSGDGQGDVAVLRLREPVPVAPARFAAGNALDLPRDLVVLGFPATGDGYGRIAAVRATTARFLIDGEWVQLQSQAAFGPVVGKGYSGAAVALPSSGEVVGMITSADRADRLGHMLPTVRLKYYWPPLMDLLPLGPLAPSDHTELRRALAGMPVDLARTAARRATEDERGPEPEPAALAAAGSAYEVAAYLAEGLYLDGTDPARIRSVLDLFRRSLISPPNDQALKPPAAEQTITVSVCVSRSGSGQRNLLLSIRLRRAGEPLAELCHEVVSRGRLRTRVQELVPQVIARHVPSGPQVAVEFVLPRGLLSLPVDDWTLGPGSVVRIGWRHPVTVRDLARFQQQAPDWDHSRRWLALCGSGCDDVVHWIGCRDAVDASKLAAALARHTERAVLALAAAPEPVATHPALRAAFDSGLPVMLWRREACTEHTEGNGAAENCTGSQFRSKMAEQMTALGNSGSLVELPEVLRRLRTEAGEAGDENHHGHGVTLLWDPPSQHPVTPPLQMARGE